MKYPLTILIEKGSRRLTASDAGGARAFACDVALGFSPRGHKLSQGDGRTPEGTYVVCLRRDSGKYGAALGISYPSADDARAAAEGGRLSPALLPLFEDAQAQGKRPPWGTPLGGEIYIHGGGATPDWTAGCIALDDKDMAALFAIARLGDRVVIQP